MTRALPIEYPGAVCEVMGETEAEIRGRQRGETVKWSRELVCHIGRRHGGLSLEELRRYLQVWERSTVTHAVRRAETRLAEQIGFQRMLDRILKLLN